MMQRQQRRPQRQIRREMLEPIAEAGTGPRWQPRPQRQQRKRIARVVRVKMPKAIETGDPVTGYRGAKLFKGTHVCRAGEGRPGTITGAGRDQCVVKWAHSGVTQAEITAYLARYGDVTKP